MTHNRVIIRNDNFYECEICVNDRPEVITAKVFVDYNQAKKAGWIFERENNKTVAYCPKCRRFADDE